MAPTRSGSRACCRRRSCSSRSRLRPCCRTAFASLPGQPRLSHQPGVMAGALTGVQLLGQESELLTTPGGTATRHAGVLVPVKGALDGAQELGLAQMIPQAVPGRCGGRHPVRAAASTLTSMSKRTVANPWQSSHSWSCRVRPWHASISDPSSPGCCLTDGPVAVEIDLSPAAPEGCLIRRCRRLPVSGCDRRCVPDCPEDVSTSVHRPFAFRRHCHR